MNQTSDRGVSLRMEEMLAGDKRAARSRDDSGVGTTPTSDALAHGDASQAPLASVERMDAARQLEKRQADSAHSGSFEPPLGIAAAAAFGGVAAVLYTLSNIALRQAVGVDALLVSAVKAIPTVILLGPFLCILLLRGQRLATSTRMVPRFLVASLIGQFLGNVSFQISLSVIGLAATVPIVLGTLIVGGGILGKLLLGEPVRRRTMVAMATLIAAVVVLSLPDGSGTGSAATTSTLPVWVGAGCAIVSGVAYSLFGTVLRQTLTGGMSSSFTMFLSGTVGTLTLGSTVLVRLGTEYLWAVAPAQWLVMFAAGAFNFAAFISMAASLKSLPVVAVNLINASQVAMAAIAGVLLFAEPVTGTLLMGIALTVLGLVVLANPKRVPVKSAA